MTGKILIDRELLKSWHADVREEAEYQMENYQEPNRKMVRVEAELRAAIDAAVAAQGEKE